MSEDKRHPFAGTEVGQPVPGKDACDPDDKVLPVGCNGLEKGLGAGGHLAVHKAFSILVQNTEVHGTSVQADTTIKLVLVSVEAHEVSSSCE